VNGPSTISSAVGEDTIELQLTPEQLRYLSEAEGAAAPVAPVRKTGRAHIVKMAAAIVAYAAFAWWSASHLAAEPQPPAMAAAKPTAVIPRPVLIARAAEPAVRVINPFDAKEVFEFPAGSSRAESREKVAQILLQRARERQSQWERVKPVETVRTASLYRSL
jgi:hypothetical protein